MSARRFWNQSLQSTYRKFVLPLQTSGPIITKKSAWTHHTHNPVHGKEAAQGSELWDLLSPSPAVGSRGGKNNRVKKNDGGAQANQGHDERVPEKRKSSLFARKAELNGKLRSYKIAMYPTQEQRRVLKSWYAACNRAYNLAVEEIRGMRNRANLISVRKAIVPNEAVPEKDREWVTKVPTKVRARAVKQCIDAQHINLKEKGFGRFKMQFRSFRKDPTGVVILEKAFSGDNGPLHHFSPYHGPRSSTGSQKKYALMHMAPKCFGDASTDKAILIRDRHWLMDKLIGDQKLMEDGKILWDKRTNSWHLIVLIDHKVKKKDDESSPPVGMVSLDPGVRTFNTFYSPDGTHGSLLVDTLKVMKDMCKDMDKVQSDIDKLKNWHKSCVKERRRQVENSEYDWTRPISIRYEAYKKSLRHMRNRFHKISARLRNWRANAHYDAINFLLERYDAVLIPEFQVNRMAAKAERVISSTVVRSMYTWSHYMFRRRLEGKAELDENKIVKVIEEPGTSKTCGGCGYWNADLGGKKIFKCSSCGMVLDRDVNGARNNMIALLK